VPDADAGGQEDLMLGLEVERVSRMRGPCEGSLCTSNTGGEVKRRGK
jgi:hypothetical protein